jgi:3-dehydrosphinganine reductase
MNFELKIIIGILSVPFFIPLIIFLGRSLYRLILKLQKLSIPRVKPSSANQLVHVLVTGGSSGIGLEVAREYLKKGFNVSLMARDEEKLKAAKESLINNTSPFSPATLSKCIHTISCDVGKGEGEVQRALAPAISDFGPIEILVNSAGITYIASFDEAEIDQFEKVMRVNYLGTVYVTRVVLPEMKKRKRGKIVFVSSQVAQVTYFL